MISVFNVWSPIMYEHINTNASSTAILPALCRAQYMRFLPAIFLVKLLHAVVLWLELTMLSVYFEWKYFEVKYSMNSLHTKMISVSIRDPWHRTGNNNSAPHFKCVVT